MKHGNCRAGRVNLDFPQYKRLQAAVLIFLGGTLLSPWSTAAQLAYAREVGDPKSRQRLLIEERRVIWQRFLFAFGGSLSPGWPRILPQDDLELLILPPMSPVLGIQIRGLVLAPN